MSQLLSPLQNQNGFWPWAMDLYMFACSFYVSPSCVFTLQLKDLVIAPQMSRYASVIYNSKLNKHLRNLNTSPWDVGNYNAYFYCLLTYCKVVNWEKYQQIHCKWKLLLVAASHRHVKDVFCSLKWNVPFEFQVLIMWKMSHFSWPFCSVWYVGMSLLSYFFFKFYLFFAVNFIF